MLTKKGDSPMGYFKQQCIDEEHKFWDRVSDKIHEFDTFQDACKWAIKENPCPWMGDEAVDHLVCEVWNEYQADQWEDEGQPSWEQEWSDFGEVYE
jgi:hypothetical protein